MSSCVPEILNREDDGENRALLGPLTSLQLRAQEPSERCLLCPPKALRPQPLRFVVKKTGLNPSDELSFDVAFAILKEKVRSN